MIFVVLANEKFPFIRLVTWVLQAVDEGIIKEEVILQHGNTPVGKLPDLITPIQWLKHEEFDEHIIKASKIVAHAGVGIFLQCRWHGRIPLLVPRNPEAGEHLDNHQLDLAQQLNEEFGLPYAATYQEFTTLLDKGLDALPVKSFRKELISFLDDTVQAS